jgi:murein DD-endopeptidase MepM/ murein hydrolase activator NlpD
MRKQILITLLLAAVLITVLYTAKRPQGMRGVKLGQPISHYDERPKLLTFGLYVTPDPETNPIDPPERFTGFHTALDLEIFPEEIDQPVEVLAICDGKVVEAKAADGYGGIIIHSCSLRGQEVTVLYGHLNPATLTRKIGEAVRTGEKLGELAPAFSAESGSTRKHLHLGIHKGTEIELLGYVQDQAALHEFLDPKELIK